MKFDNSQFNYQIHTKDERTLGALLDAVFIGYEDFIQETPIRHISRDELRRALAEVCEEILNDHSRRQRRA